MLGVEPKILLYALLGGIIPALLWLWFWLRDDDKKPEPKGYILLAFIVGMLSVFLVLPLEKLVQMITTNLTAQIISWAVIEEVIKFGAISLAALHTKYIDEPSDYAIYLVTGALGFAALENALFLIDPLTLSDTVLTLLTSNMRFLGSMLMHAMASSIIGIALGFAFYRRKHIRHVYFVIGFILAVALHAVYNFFIINDNGSNFLIIFAILWVVAIIRILIFERVRTLGERVG